MKEQRFYAGTVLAEFSTMLRSIFFTFVLLTLCAPAPAQDREVFARLLKSDEAATKLISDLSAYDSKSPWSTDVIWSLAQKLAVKGLKGQDISRTIVGSGEVAAALDGNDRLFASIAWITGGIYKEPHPGPSLYTLEQLGVPAFDILGEMLGRSGREVRELSDDERLRSEPCAALLAEGYRRRYSGMSEKLAAKRR